jgi:hypothetical protein
VFVAAVTLADDTPAAPKIGFPSPSWNATGGRSSACCSPRRSPPPNVAATPVRQLVTAAGEAHGDGEAGRPQPTGWGMDDDVTSPDLLACAGRLADA